MYYTIVVYCSENQKDVLNLTLDSWLNSSANTVILCTDFDFKRQHSKLKVLKIFEPTEDYGTNCARKAESLQHILANYQYKNVLMIDADCYIITDVDSIFGEKFDMCVSMPQNVNINKIFNNVSAGFIALQRSDATKGFMSQWVTEQRRNQRSRARDQIALSKIISACWSQSTHRITEVAELEYNCYPAYDNQEGIARWIEKIEKYRDRINILHFAYGTWKNPSLVKYVLSIMKEKAP